MHSSFLGLSFEIENNKTQVVLLPAIARGWICNALVKFTICSGSFRQRNQANIYAVTWNSAGARCITSTGLVW